MEGENDSGGFQALKACADLFLKFAESAAHRELTQRLTDIAKRHGFDEEFDINERLNPRPDPSCEPDVCRINIQREVFLADAKVTETPGLEATKKRIAGYFDAFCRHRESGNIPGGYLLIGLHEPEPAHRWKSVLNQIASEVGFETPNFEVTQANDRVWLVVWRVRP